MYTKINNIFDSENHDNNINQEIIENLFSNEKIKFEKIISNGVCSPISFWYDQDENEFILIIDGNAILEFEDGILKMKKGDYFIIKAHLKHRVKWTSKDCLWFCVFF